MAFWLMACLAVIADARPFTPLGRRRSVPIQPSVCFTFAILLGWGLGPAIAVQALAVGVSAVRMRSGIRRAALRFGQYALAFGAADLVLRAAALRPYPTDRALSVAGVAGAVIAAAVWFLVMSAVDTVAQRPRSGPPGRPHAIRSMLPESLTCGALLLLSPILVVAAAANPALVLLAVVPLLAVGRMARLAAEQSALTRHDSLTGLASRKELVTAVADQVTAHRSAGREPPRRLALLLLDLDRFKNVNDALGHEVGDRLLIEVARRLYAAVGAHDVAARLGGDEFAILARHVSGTADACAVANRVSASLAEPVHLDGLPLDVSAAIGVAVYPEHGADVETLMRHADVAMYDAKQRAAPVAVYTAESDHHSPARLALLADLREALRAPSGAGVQMHYQPQIEIQTGEVVGVEALLRWHHPTRGPVSPEYLIKAAEHTAVMRLLTLRIVDSVVEQLAKWAADGIHLRASVNVSVRDLQTGQVAERLAGQLRDHGVPASRLQLEITEGALMADPRRVLATIAALDRLGVAISLDDFGTGYSSLQHLRRLPLTEVKVDRSFVIGMSRASDDASIVRSVVGLAGALGLRVVAEGVEDEATWRQLAAAGCDIAQGWFFARPMPGDALGPWLERYRPLPASLLQRGSQRARGASPGEDGQGA